eukprot:COSAG01_NODE_2264_length_8047_cov_18.774409_2_plen_76_part_00
MLARGATSILGWATAAATRPGCYSRSRHSPSSPPPLMAAALLLRLAVPGTHAACLTTALGCFLRTSAARRADVPG